MIGWCAIHHRQIIFKFVFENLSLEIAHAYHSLLWTCLAAVAISRSLTFACVPHEDSDIAVIYMNSTENEEQVTWLFPCSFTDTVKYFLLQLYAKICDVTPWFYTRLDNLTRSEGHVTLWVISKVHTFKIYSASQITVITSCDLSIEH